MKKIILLLVVIFLYAVSKEEFLDYTNKLVTYNFELKNIEKINSPFYRLKKYNFFKNKAIKKIVRISLISVFNNNALIKVDEYMGEELVKKYKKWIKMGDKIENCYVKKIYVNKITLKCGKKLLTKNINTKFLNVRIDQ